MTEVTAVCDHAEYIFIRDHGFGLILDFIMEKDHHGTCHYIFDYHEMLNILKMLNIGKTGFAEDEVEQEGLERLVGMTAKITVDDDAEGTTHFRGFIQ